MGPFFTPCADDNYYYGLAFASGISKCTGTAHTAVGQAGSSNSNLDWTHLRWKA